MELHLPRGHLLGDGLEDGGPMHAQAMALKQQSPHAVVELGRNPYKLIGNYKNKLFNCLIPIKRPIQKPPSDPHPGPVDLLLGVCLYVKARAGAGPE